MLDFVERRVKVASRNGVHSIVYFCSRGKSLHWIPLAPAMADYDLHGENFMILYVHQLHGSELVSQLPCGHHPCTAAGDDASIAPWISHSL